MLQITSLLLCLRQLLLLKILRVLVRRLVMLRLLVQIGLETFARRVEKTGRAAIPIFKMKWKSAALEPLLAWGPQDLFHIVIGE